MPLSFLKKLYSYTNIGSAYILELEQIHEREAFTNPSLAFQATKKHIFPSQKAQKTSKLRFCCSLNSTV